jgi:hypothetical protein
MLPSAENVEKKQEGGGRRRRRGLDAARPADVAARGVSRREGGSREGGGEAREPLARCDDRERHCGHERNHGDAVADGGLCLCRCALAATRAVLDSAAAGGDAAPAPAAAATEKKLMGRVGGMSSVVGGVAF